MFSLGGQEILIIVVLALLLFGPDKIPQLARTIGRFTREFNKYKGIMESTIRMEISNAEGPTTDELTVEQRIAKAGAASTALIERAAGSSGEGPGGDARAVSSGGDTAEPESAAQVHAAPSADESDEEGEE